MIKIFKLLTTHVEVFLLRVSNNMFATQKKML
jgi:hypothetical protein